jgi:hypothetical protein
VEEAGGGDFIHGGFVGNHGWGAGRSRGLLGCSVERGKDGDMPFPGRGCHVSMGEERSLTGEVERSVWAGQDPHQDRHEISQQRLFFFISITFSYTEL